MTDDAHEAVSVQSPLRVVSLAVLTAAICAVLAFHRLGEASLFGDEAILANVARNAAVNGHWYPLDGGLERYVSKPPLSIWPMAARFAVAGASELNVRIGSAIGGVLASMLLFVLGTWLIDAHAGAIAALLLTTAPPWLLEHGVREGVGDIWTALWSGLALLLYVRFRLTGARGMLAAAIVCAMAGSLIKGPVVFLLLGGVGVMWEVAAKRMLALRPRWGVLCGFVLVSAVPFAVWIADNVAHDAWTRAKMWSQFIGRHLQAIDPTHIHGALFYPRVVRQAFGVWLVALLLPMLWTWMRTNGTALLLPLWAVFPIVAFSPSVSKLPWYVDPALPPLALLIAAAVVLGMARVRSPAARFALGAIVAGLLTMRVFAAWNVVDATPRRTDMHRFLAAYRGAKRPLLYIDALPAVSYAYREWNYYYLNFARDEWRAIPPSIDRSRCSAVITTRPEQLLHRADFAGAQTLQVHKYDPREADLYVIDLCGGRFAAALAVDGG